MKLWFGLFFVAAELFANPIKVTLKTIPEDLWSAAERDYVQRASQIVFERITRADVANCAYRNTFRDKFTKDQLRTRWGNQIPVINKGREADLVIQKEKMDRNILGLAQVGTAKVDHNKFKVLNLKISLNEDQLSQNVRSYSNRSQSDDKMNQWISVIAHEIAHNFGYNHGSLSGNWTADYPGYFVTELGFCTMTDGRFGSDLGDVNVRREIMKKYGVKS